MQLLNGEFAAGNGEWTVGGAQQRAEADDQKKENFSDGPGEEVGYFFHRVVICFVSFDTNCFAVLRNSLRTSGGREVFLLYRLMLSPSDPSF